MALSARGRRRRYTPFAGRPDGATPTGDVVFDTFGALYGTTNRGGTGNRRRTDCGTVFEPIPPAGARETWRHRALANFDGKNGGDPEVAPNFLLGSLCGIANYGGRTNLGTGWLPPSGEPELRRSVEPAG